MQNHVIMPNFIEIAQSAVEISQFLDLSKWRLPLSWILNFLIFNGRTRQEGRTTSLCQISTKSLKSRPTYGDFLLFKMAAAAILDFKNFRFSTVATFKRVKLHHSTTFRRNRTNRPRAEPRHMSHKPRKSVARFELGV